MAAQDTLLCSALHCTVYNRTISMSWRKVKMKWLIASKNTSLKYSFYNNDESTWTCVCIYVTVCVWQSVCVLVCVHVRECVSVCMYVCECVCVCVWVCDCVSVSVNCYCSGGNLGPMPTCALTRPALGLGVRSWVTVTAAPSPPPPPTPSSSPLTVPTPPSLPSLPLIHFSSSSYSFSYYFSYVSGTSTSSYSFVSSILYPLFNLLHLLFLSLYLCHLTRSSPHMRSPPILFCLASPHHSHYYHPLHLCPSHFLHLASLRC